MIDRPRYICETILEWKRATWKAFIDKSNEIHFSEVLIEL